MRTSLDIGKRLPASVRAGRSVFRASLSCLPRSFRGDFGAEMVDVFTGAALRAWNQSGAGGVVGYCLVALPDLFRSAIAERRGARARASDPVPGPGPTARPGRTRKQMFDDLRQDLRYAARTLAQRPAFTVAATLSLALGIGANVAIFSVVDAVLLHPLPIERPEELVGPGSSIVTYPAYRDFRDRARSFDGLAAWDTMGRRLVFRRGDAISVVPGVLVSGNYFSVLGVEPHLGRLLAPTDDLEAGAVPVAVISYDLWRRDFAADPAIVGTEVRVNEVPLTVVGVAPPGFKGERLNDVKDVWIPLAMHGELTEAGADQLRNRGAWWIRMMGRLAPGATAAQALAELNAIGAQLAGEHPRTDFEWVFEELLPANTIATISQRSDLTRFVRLLVATVAAALLIACANVSTLQLLRSEQRRRELALRRAVGASRGRLVRQLFTESALLAAIGGHKQSELITHTLVY